MRIVFTWQPKEWREAYLLTTTEPQRRSAPPSMSYFVLALMALGGVGDVVHTLRTSRFTGVRGTLVPVLLGLALAVGMVLLGAHLLRQRRRTRDLPAVPVGPQQVVLQENGWKVDTVGHAPRPIQDWNTLQGQRRGQTVVALLTRDGEVVGVPLRAMDEEQDGSMHRLLLRKILPPAA